MKSKLRFQKFQALLFVQGLFALHLTAPDVASAVGFGTNPNIKETNYPIHSGAYFVSPNGKETNSGKAPNSPWPVDKALKLARSGATIVFRGGTYRNVNAVKIRKKLTLQPYPHEKAWIKGSVVVNGWVAEGNMWRKDGWGHSFPHKEKKKHIDPNYPLAGHRDMVYINGVSLKQVGSKAQVKQGKFYVDAANNRLYIGNNPAGKMVEATVHSEAFSMWQGRSSNPRGAIIRGLGFAHYADEAIWVAAPKVTLENNTFAWNGLAGVNIFGTDNTLRGNTFSHNGRKGLGLHKADRTLLQNNKISDNNVEHFALTWDAAGVKVTKSKGVIWRNNIVEHNQATGMWVDVSSSSTTIVNNTIRYNEGIGVLHEISHQGIIAGNLVYNNDTAGIMVADSSNVRVYNNTLSMNYKHIVVKDSSRTNNNAKDIAAGIRWIARDNVIKNNIFGMTKGGNFFEAANCQLKVQSARMIAATDYNAYYRKVSSKPQKVINWSLGQRKCSVGYGSIAAFKSATGFEANALYLDGGLDPFFVNAAKGDFRLKPGSPAIGRGQALPPDIASAIGLPPGTGVDLGAVQY